MSALTNFSRPIGKCIRFLAAFLLLASPASAADPLGTMKSDSPQMRTDRHGDPLPDGAIARLGTVRWRHGFIIKALAYSRDGKKIAAVTPYHALTLWDAATGKAL